METHFASSARTGDKELKVEIEIISQNVLVQGLLYSVSGVLAVLDEQRQVVALNDSFLKMLGIESPGEALGLRLGESLQCVHSQDGPGGCGTTRFCSTCGAAVAIVTSLAEDRPVERTCALTANRPEAVVDIALLVRSHPLTICGRRFLLLFLQDVTLQEQRAALERTFFHDIKNMLTGLLGASEQLVDTHRESRLAKIVHHSALRLSNEVAIQNCLFQRDAGDYQPLRHEITPQQVLNEVQNVFTNHPATLTKHLLLPDSAPELTLTTDMSLVVRVLCNMVTNALEATEDNGEVKVWVENGGNALVFCVWNRQWIPENVSLRIFQRNFSTKNQAGRGVGTYSMKLFGEKILGGKVRFISSENDGTTFSFSLPLC